jgi:hypothetical protein
MPWAGSAVVTAQSPPHPPRGVCSPVPGAERTGTSAPLPLEETDTSRCWKGCPDGGTAGENTSVASHAIAEAGVPVNLPRAPPPQPQQNERRPRGGCVLHLRAPVRHSKHRNSSSSLVCDGGSSSSRCSLSLATVRWRRGERGRVTEGRPPGVALPPVPPLPTVSPPALQKTCKKMFEASEAQKPKHLVCGCVCGCVCGGGVAHASIQDVHELRAPRAGYCS